MNKSIIFLLDVSAAMLSNGKGEALFHIMKKLDSVFQRVQPPEEMNLTIRILAFGDDAITWVYGNQDSGVPFRDFRWDDAKAKMPNFKGLTPLGKAVAEIVETLYYNDVAADPNQAAPIIILISEGCPTDNYQEEFQKALNKKADDESQGLFRRSLRVSIGLGLSHSQADEIERNLLKSFGCLSRSLRERGLKSYYDIADGDDIECLIAELIDIYGDIGFLQKPIIGEEGD